MRLSRLLFEDIASATPSYNTHSQKLPSLLRLRRYRRALDPSFDPLVCELHGVASESGVKVAKAEEVRVKHRNEKGVAEEQSTQDNASQNKELDAGNQRHGRLIVVFDPHMNLSRNWWLGRWLWLAIGTRGLGDRGLDEFGQNVGARESQRMEQRENGIGQDSEGDGFGEQPKESEEEVLGVLVRHGSMEINFAELRWPK